MSIYLFQPDDSTNLVGGDWNHGMDYDFPFSWECHTPN